MTTKPITSMHWNAESVTNKKTMLEHILHEENINICCMQELHLQSNKSFKARGCQCSRSDRPDRSKARVMTLVRDNIKACLTETHLEDSNYQSLRIQAHTANIQLINIYCPHDKPLSFDTISTSLQLCHTWRLQQPLTELGISADGSKRWRIGRMRTVYL